ncbi:TonB-dependent receptor [Sphingobacterium faecale]|uniref:TonB-dependent receptor n=1 Tax=Sphingobacterium faecale TaxID=2803775 RepID=A0ABS1R9S3_9SPHI|nr:TonB-dependent receptor [Sphingobacterium faecale]MBL1411463.1 TonB-dependent receptor [Sphingobacterium faecale]
MMINRFMSISLFLSFLLMLFHDCIYAQSQAKVTINANNTTIKQVLKIIEEQTDYSFFYDDNELNLSQKININIKVVSLKEALKKIFEGKEIKYEIKNRHIILNKSTPAGKIKPVESPPPPSKINGRVTDKQGKPIANVKVALKWSATVVATDAEGYFTIEAPYANATLEFSSIGFKPTQLQLEGKTEIAITMQEEVTELTEAVVVGYGTQKKISLTGSVSSASMSGIRATATPSLSNTLAGSMSGIITQQVSGEPGNDASQLLIRGMGTWENRNPLTLVDGIERDINTINSYEIESITMLKDASATAVYGVRGANGVILITTQRGIEGKPKVTFRTENAVLSALRLPKYIDGSAYAELVNEALANANKPAKYTPEDISLYKDGTDPYFHPNIDWSNLILKKNTSQSINNLSVTGGNTFVKYFTSVGYTKQMGIYHEDPNVTYRTNANVSRYNFRSNVDIQVAKNLELNLGLGGIIQHNYYPGASSDEIFMAMRKISPIEYFPINPDGTMSGGTSYLNNNPWGLATNAGYARYDRNSLQGTFGSRWDLSDLITKGLAIKGTFSYDHYTNVANLHRKEFETKRYDGKDNQGNDLYTIFREDKPMGYQTAHGDNSYSGIGRSVYTEVAVNYDRIIEKHSIGGLLLANRNEHVNLGTDNSRYNLPYRRQGVAARINYGYDQRYLLEFNMGYNGSENFPKDKRYGFFPSVSAGWILSNERFWSTKSPVGYLKLRGSIGQVGNDQIGGRRFLFENIYTKSVHDANFGMSQTPYPGLSEMQIGNQNVTWEVATKGNMGMDMYLFNNALQIQIDGFYEHRTGILLKRDGAIPEVSGINGAVLPYANLGVVENKGIDGMIEYRKRAGDFYYSLRSTFTFARNKVLENDEAKPKWSYQSRIGKRIDQHFGLVANGFFRDQDDIDSSPDQTYFQTTIKPGDIKYLDINKDGIIDTYDEIAIGNPRTPEMVAGMGFTIGYKNFEISAFLNGVSNTSLFIEGEGIYAFSDGLGTYNIFREYYENRWKPDDRENAKYPAASDNNSPNNNRRSTLYMRNASFLRLRTAEIAFYVPDNINKKIGISNARFFLNGMNLVTLDNIKIMNPESNNGTGGYPLQRSFNLGLQIGF